jgi:hypothetical protein
VAKVARDVATNTSKAFNDLMGKPAEHGGTGSAPPNVSPDAYARPSDPHPDEAADVEPESARVEPAGDPDEADTPADPTPIRRAGKAPTGKKPGPKRPKKPRA